VWPARLVPTTIPHRSAVRHNRLRTFGPSAALRRSRLTASFRSNRFTHPRKESMARPVSNTDARHDSGSHPAPQVAVRLDAVSKRFGDVSAVDGVTLDVFLGEFFSILGPSGSGKTTCLRMIAGFETPTQGRILLRDRDVTNLAPYERDVNTVFQDYALFPHMTVAENVEYGLKVKGVPREERRGR